MESQFEAGQVVYHVLRAWRDEKEIEKRKEEIEQEKEQTNSSLNRVRVTLSEYRDHPSGRRWLTGYDLQGRSIWTLEQDLEAIV